LTGYLRYSFLTNRVDARCLAGLYTTLVQENIQTFSATIAQVNVVKYILEIKGAEGGDDAKAFARNYVANAHAR